MSLNLTRRSFIKATAVVAAMGAHPAFALPTKAPAKWDFEADIIVIGAGGAGASAALTAVQSGLSVIVLEKLALTGGSSTICGGATAWAGTDMQAKEGVKDSNEQFINDMMKVGENVNDKELVTAYVTNGLETYNWLKANGAVFNSLGIASGMSVPRVHYVTPSQVLKALFDRARDAKAEIVLNAAAERLIADDNNKIIGVQAKVRNRVTNYRAKKAVVLASGGFGLNKELYAITVPSMAAAKVMCGLGSDGDGLKMAWAYGAGLADTPYIKATFGFPPSAASMADFVLVFYHGGIVVNKDGKRFCDESKSYKLVGDAALAQKDAIGIQLYDHAIREVSIKDNFGRADLLEAKGGMVFKADTLEELAKLINVDPKTLVDTVKEYNANVDKGSDPLFGRTSLTSGYGKLVKIEKAPFYAIPSTAVILATYAGITVNPKTQVVDIFKQPIQGLYAAGEVVGGVHGAAYMTGTAFGKALTMGRMAIKEITKG